MWAVGSCATHSCCFSLLISIQYSTVESAPSPRSGTNPTVSGEDKRPRSTLVDAMIILCSNKRDGLLFKAVAAIATAFARSWNSVGWRRSLEVGGLNEASYFSHDSRSQRSILLFEDGYWTSNLMDDILVGRGL